MSNSSKNMDISIFLDLPPTIRFRVFKEGKLLYKRDEIALQRVKVDTLKSYLDIQQMIKLKGTVFIKFVERIKEALKE